MNNIIYDDNIITPENDNNYNYYNNFTNRLNKKDCVKFALFCAKTVNSNSKESFHCIELVEKWLKDAKSVSKQELWKAANTAYIAYYDFNASASAVYSAANAAQTAYYTFNSISKNTYYSVMAADSAVWAIFYNYITNDMNLYLQTLLRTTKQYNTINHNNQHCEFILKEIINEDIDNLTDTDYNMLIDLSQEYYNINPNITNKRIFIELLRREYE